MTKRRVRPEELELWKQVTRGTDPLAKRPKPKELPDPVAPPLPEVGPPPAKPIPAFKIGQSTRPDGQSTSLPSLDRNRLAQNPVQMDAKAFQRLKRGKLRPEAKLDLHGMTLANAHPALTRFILMSQGQGMRLVLVITGKGDREDPYDPMPRRRGVLRTQVPQWLRLPPLSGAVLQVADAHIRHGGGGALYVYLRRL